MGINSCYESEGIIINQETIAALNGVFHSNVSQPQELISAPVVPPVQPEPVASAEPVVVTDALVVTTDTPISLTAVEAEKDRVQATTDHEYARGSMYATIMKADELVNKALEIAQQADHPRAIEVAAKAIDSLVAANEKLMVLHKVRQDIKQAIDKTSGSVSGNVPNTAVQVNANNVVFSGSSKDLLDAVNQNRR